MNSYLIFVPGAAALAACGLGDIADDARAFDSPVTPSGVAGKFYAWGDPTNPAKNIPFAYLPDQQEWQQAPGGAYWFGVMKDRRPDPASLARRKQITGVGVVMADGNLWTLPNVVSLPVNFSLLPDGTESTTVKPQYRKIEERIGWAFSQLDASFRGQDANPVECRRFVAEMLCVNYRLVPEMAYMLGLLDSETWLSAMAATVDYRRLTALRQEIVSGGESITPGR